jgi:hypothetical protein
VNAERPPHACPRPAAAAAAAGRSLRALRRVRAGARFDKGVMVERPDEVEEVGA